jgi:hypothetical protein
MVQARTRCFSPVIEGVRKIGKQRQIMKRIKSGITEEIEEFLFVETHKTDMILGHRLCVYRTSSQIWNLGAECTNLLEAALLCNKG